MEITNIFDRLEYIIEKEGLTIASFSKKIGAGDQTIRSIIKYKRNFPGYEVLLKIIQTFAWVDAGWLLTGDGEMLKEDQEAFVLKEPDLLYGSKECWKTIHNLSETLNRQSKQIEELKKELADCKKFSPAPKGTARDAAAG
jgi:hypothetical protein